MSVSIPGGKKAGNQPQHALAEIKIRPLFHNLKPVTVQRPFKKKRARDGIRTLPMSRKLLKSRRNAHCLTCVYRLSTTWKIERKAVKGSAEQIHFTPLLLVIEVDNVSKRSEEHTSDSSHRSLSRMPSSA